MPLVEPPGGLREKLVIISAGGGGKTSSWLSIAWWAFQSGDTRQFYVLDTDDEAVLQVMADAKYDGMLRSLNGELVNEGGNINLWTARVWDDFQGFSDTVVANAVKGDFVVLDFVSHVWGAAQDEYYYQRAAEEAKKGKDAKPDMPETKDEAMFKVGVKGISGWDMFKAADVNWQAVNGAYFSMMKPILLTSRAHVVMTSEEEEIKETSNMTFDAKEHMAQFGKWKAAGVQKKIPYQCRTFLRIQRLARGRVLHTLKDRARPELSGADMKPDFFSAYLKDVAGWSVTDPT